MKIVVQKYGGSSVADTEKLFNVCKNIIKEKEKGKSLVVVVSAQGNTTDELIKQEREITKQRNEREYDVLVSVGEQITVAKLAMCLKELGYEAESFLGWQVPIITDCNHGDANIVKIRTRNIISKLNKDNQGVDIDNNITTLGRGGSDTTAIALAAALHAEKCEIFKDVDGVYSEDPHVNKNAIKYDKISYDKMLAMSNNGAKVLHNKCVQIAKDNKIKIIVKSTFKENNIGTIVYN